MLISSLSKMEKIVSSNPSLHWDGWDVIKLTPRPNAVYSKNGVFRDGKWFEQKVFPITESGWNLPNNLGRVNAQVAG